MKNQLRTQNKAKILKNKKNPKKTKKNFAIFLNCLVKHEILIPCLIKFIKSLEIFLVIFVCYCMTHKHKMSVIKVGYC